MIGEGGSNNVTRDSLPTSIMTSSRANVLLLRAPSCGTEDKYEAVFDSLKYDVSSVPVLETVLSNLDQLKDILAHGLQGVQPSAVICTSSRACQAWKEAVAEPSSMYHIEDDRL